MPLAQYIRPAAIAATIGSAASMVFSCIDFESDRLDLEVLGGVALFVMPHFVASGVFFAAVLHLTSHFGWSLFTFAFPVIVPLSMAVYAQWVNSSDGGPEMARFLLAAYVAGWLAAIISLFILKRRMTMST